MAEESEKRVKLRSKGGGVTPMSTHDTTGSESENSRPTTAVSLSDSVISDGGKFVRKETKSSGSNYDILKQQLKVALSEISRQKLRNIQIHMRRIANVDSRVKASDLWDLFTEHNLAIGKKTFQLLLDHFSDPFGIEYESILKLMKETHSRTGRDSVQAKYQVTRKEEKKELVLESDLDMQLLDSLKQRFKANTLTQFSLIVFEDQLEQLDYTKSGVLSKKEVRKVAESMQLPIYGHLISQLYNRCDRESNSQISWPLLMNFLEAAIGGPNCRVTVTRAKEEEVKKDTEMEFDQSKIEEFKLKQKAEDNTKKAIINEMFSKNKSRPGTGKSLFSAIKNAAGNASGSDIEGGHVIPNIAQKASTGEKKLAGGILSVDLKAKLQSAAAMEKEAQSEEAKNNAVSSAGNKEKIKVYQKPGSPVSLTPSDDRSLSPGLKVISEGPRRASVNPNAILNKAVNEVAKQTLLQKAPTSRRLRKTSNGSNASQASDSESNKPAKPKGADSPKSAMKTGQSKLLNLRESTNKALVASATDTTSVTSRKISKGSDVGSKISESDTKISDRKVDKASPNQNENRKSSGGKQPNVTSAVVQIQNTQPNNSDIEKATGGKDRPANGTSKPVSKNGIRKMNNKVAPLQPISANENEATEIENAKSVTENAQFQKVKKKRRKKSGRPGEKNAGNTDTEAEGKVGDSNAKQVETAETDTNDNSDAKSTSSLASSSDATPTSARRQTSASSRLNKQTKPAVNKIQNRSSEKTGTVEKQPTITPVEPIDLSEITGQPPPSLKGVKKEVTVKDGEVMVADVGKLTPNVLKARQVKQAKMADSDFSEPIYPPAPKGVKPKTIEVDGSDEVGSKFKVKVWPSDSLSLKMVEPQVTKHSLKLQWIYGYRGNDCRNNLHLMSTGELIYNVSSFVILLEPKSWQQRFYLEHKTTVSGVVVHNEGVLVASAQEEQLPKDPNGNKTQNNIKACIRVWDCVTLNTVAVLNHAYLKGGVAAMSFSNEKNFLVSVSSESREEAYKRLCVWESTSGTLLSSAQLDNPSIICTLSVYLSSVSHSLWICTGGKDFLSFHTVQTSAPYNIEQDPPNFGKEERAGFYISSTFDSSGLLYTGDSDGKLLLWDSERVVCASINKCHEGAVFCILVSEDSSFMLTGGRDGTVNTWDLSQQNYFQKTNSITMPEKHGACRTMALSMNKLFVGSTANSILSFFIPSSATAATLNSQAKTPTSFTTLTQGHYEQIRGVTNLRNALLGAHFLTAGYDGMVLFFNCELKRLVWKHLLVNTAPTCVDIHEDACTIAMGTKDGSLILVKVKDGTSPEVKVKVAKAKINCIKFSKDYSCLALGSQDGNTYVFRSSDFRKFDETPPEELARLQGTSGPISFLDWSEQLRQGNYIIRTLTAGGTLKHWNAGTCEQWADSEMRSVDWLTTKCMFEYSTSGLFDHVNNTQHPVTNVSRLNSILAAGTENGKILLGDYPCLTSSGNIPPQLAEEKAFNGKISSVEFVTENCLVATSTEDQCIQQWRVL